MMSNHNRFYRLSSLLLNFILVITLLASPHPAYASLSQQDHDDLTESLQILSTGWVQEHVSRANTILTKAEYTAADWQEFFGEYFSTNPFNNNLRDYLGYPVFWWFEDDVHLKLQTGLTLPLQTVIQTILAEHAADLGSALAADDNLRQTLFNTHRFFNDMFNYGVIDESVKTEIYNFYTAHVNTYPHLWKSTVTIDTAAQPCVASVRAQIFANLGDALTLTTERKVEIAQTIELSGTYAVLWEDYTVLILDNNGLDQAQLDVIDVYMGALPAGIHDLRYMTVNYFLGNEGVYSEWLAASAAVNTVESKVGEWSENGFPEDVSPVYTDGFSLFLVHEVNHRTDVTFSRNYPDLAQRRDDLISAAGTDHMNYLRSMVEDGFYVDAPQEFFAEIANQWFANSARTLELGLVRWENGYKDPINQFLFFAEVYAMGGNSVLFYTIDEQGILTHTDIPVHRDPYGHIHSLIVNGVTYRFLLNSEGDVLGLLTNVATLPFVLK